MLFALVVRPAVGRSAASRPLDYALIAVALAPLLQVIPLPKALVGALSPHSVPVRLALALDPRTVPAWVPLSIDPRSTLWASLVTAGAIALFFAARAIFEHGGVRQTVRGVSSMGFAVSIIAMAQAATAGRLIYWRFPTEYEGPLPFGPFVNRNHFATWAIMAAPLCLGYIAARANRMAAAQAAVANRRVRLARLADGRSLWLTAAGAAMIAALLISLSRSGIVSLAGAATLTALHLRPRAAAARGWWALAALVITIGIGITRADLPGVANRFSQSASGVANRTRIWKDTLPVVRDFWPTGTGAGTYRTAMLYYQRSERVVQFNQAHNHYLQAAAEEGLVLGACIACALAALAQAMRKRLSADTSGAYWIRAGAATGLVAVALQSLWETGLVMPANAALAAVLAAIALHERLPAEKSIFMN
jgi:hypothetical protein